MPKPQAKAKRILRLADVPPVPPDTPFDNSNGDFVFSTVEADGERRWRFNAEGACKYYFRTQPGKGRELPYEEMYRG